jgi:mRNA-degrading endonuclease YafQ of YafQ-DinJ toxin-antitoxin module
MKHVLLLSENFKRAVRRTTKGQPWLTKKISRALELLEADPYQPKLRTHELTGVLGESWACSADYDLRIVFDFTTHQGQPAIRLKDIGTHDEVY